MTQLKLGGWQRQFKEQPARQIRPAKGGGSRCAHCSPRIQGNEWAFLLRLENLDWNCPQHITPRFTAAEIEIARSPLRARIAALEAENQALRTQMADANSKEEHL
jgi:hypothetical protein